ncbi:MAG: hypothetical protein IPP19_14290 [Verrucomicrobia bacterium]|nr:hypothetical protein [Verrucomicrobiota bacterium]
MNNSPIITRTILEPAPRSSAGISDIGWAHASDFVEASDEIIWSENNNELISLLAKARAL